MTASETMVAVVCDKYGPPDTLRVTEVPAPSPRADQVRVHIHAAAVTQSDIFIRSAKVKPTLQIPFRLMMGLTRPRNPIIGFAFSGVIDQTGEQTSRFKPGDEVYGMTGFRLGAYAEYRCMIETDSRQHGCLAPKPNNLSHEEATAAGYGGLLALQYSEKGEIQPGDNVMIYGASGTSGTLAVQYAKHRGATVTGVCSARNADLVRSLGADQVLDYNRVDAPPEEERYDFVLDSVGGIKTSKLKESAKRALTSEGRYVSIDDGDLELSSQRLDRLRELFEAETLTPVVDRTYPLEEIVEAHRYVEDGHKRGGVAVTVSA